MKLKSFLYLTQLEEYNPNRINAWLKNNPGREVIEIKKQLVWTLKIKILYLISRLLFFLPPEKSVFIGLKLLSPFITFSKLILLTLAKIKLALFHRQLKVIVITGSWGKTTLKETLLRSLSSYYKVSATVANQNTLEGICLQVLKLPINTRIFICEAGAYYPGDIAAICKLVKAQIGIITAIGSMHLERFGSLERIQKTKMELAEYISPGGYLYLPQSQQKTIKKFNIKTKNIFYFKQINNIYQHLSRLLNIPKITPIESSEHRLQIIKNASITIIDDTYNSNPVGFVMALDKLKSFKSKNNILVTPGMIELGDLQFSENVRLAKIASKICQHIIIVGKTNRKAFASALNSKAKFVDTISQSQSLLSSLCTPDCVILFENDLPDHYF